MADDGTDVSYAGRRVASVIDEFRAAGVGFVYSTNVVTDDLYVAFEPYGAAMLAEVDFCEPVLDHEFH